MARDTGHKSDCLKAFKSCAETSGHHGLNQAGGANSLVLRSIWICVTALGYCMFGWHMYTLIVRYLDHPVTTITLHKRASFRFPDVTICPLMPFSMKMLAYHSKDLQDITGLDKHAFDRIINLARLQKQDFFVSCRFNEADCDLDRIQTIADPLYKHCYRIQLNQSVMYRKRTMDNGLNLILFIDNQDDLETPAIISQTAVKYEWESTGVRLVAHEPDTNPHPSLNGLFIGPGVDAKVSLTIEKIRLYPTISRSTGKAKCIEKRGNVTFCHPHSDMRGTFLETQDDCFSLTVQEYVYSKCKCLSEWHDVPVSLCDAEHCSMLNSTCSVETLDKLAQLYDEVTKDCRSLCVTENWRVRLSSGTWPTYATRGHILDIVRQSYLQSVAVNNFSALEELAHGDVGSFDFFKLLRRNLVKVTIYPECLAGDYVYEELAYPLGSFLSELGGILGMWLGCSVLTFFEPIAAIISASYSVLLRKKQKKREENENQAQSNAISSLQGEDGKIIYTKIMLD